MRVDRLKVAGSGFIVSGAGAEAIVAGVLVLAAGADVYGAGTGTVVAGVSVLATGTVSISYIWPE